MFGFELDLSVRLVTPGKKGFLGSADFFAFSFNEDMVAFGCLMLVPGFFTFLSMPLSSLICTFFSIPLIH